MRRDLPKGRETEILLIDLLFIYCINNLMFRLLYTYVRTRFITLHFVHLHYLFEFFYVCVLTNFCCLYVHNLNGVIMLQFYIQLPFHFTLFRFITLCIRMHFLH